MKYSSRLKASALARIHPLSSTNFRATARRKCHNDITRSAPRRLTSPHWTSLSRRHNPLIFLLRHAEGPNGEVSSFSNRRLRVCHPRRPCGFPRAHKTAADCRTSLSLPQSSRMLTEGPVLIRRKDRHDRRARSAFQYLPIDPPAREVAETSTGSVWHPRGICLERHRECVMDHSAHDRSIDVSFLSLLPLP